MIILGTNSIKDTGYNVANSCRFNDGSSDYLTKADANPVSNNKTATYSFWCKRASLGSNQIVFQHALDGTHESMIKFRDSDVFEFHAYNGDTASPHWVALYRTTQVFRDPSAWLHFVVALDSTSGTAGNRVKMYVNGTQITDFIGGSENIVPSQNANFMIDGGNSYNNRVGANAYNGNDPFDGYLAEFVFIDGQQLTPDSFGEFDEDSPTIWKPKDVSDLTFGTKGFYLDFEDSSNLGNDANGGTDFTATNLTAVDQSTDTCTNNFATLNPLSIKTTMTLSEGNLTVANTASQGLSISTIAVTQGKWYFETKQTIASSSGYSVMIGVAKVDNIDVTDYFGENANSWGYASDNNKFHNGTATSSYGNASNSVGEIYMCALDLDNSKIFFGLNGTWFDSGNPASGTNPAYSNVSGTISFGSRPYDNTASINFGSPAFAISSGNTDGNGYGNFEYAVPSGYYSLNTKNLAEFG